MISAFCSLESEYFSFLIAFFITGFLLYFERYEADFYHLPILNEKVIY